jgi:exonuclease SbcD
MRILHTADWHLCDRLGRIDRTADLQARVEAVAKLCEEHAVDVLLVAGDVFSEQASVEQMTAALEHLHKTFKDFFARRGTIVAITGNHDRDGRINMVRAGMRLAAPVPGPGGHLSPGRMYLINGRFLASLEDRAGGRVQFLLVPYPTVSRYAESGDRYFTKEEENRLLHARVAGWVHGVTERPDFDVKMPTVFVAHLHVRGAEVHSLYRLTERDDVVFDPGFLPTCAYVALGHVHKPQSLHGMEHVRYCGSLDRLDFGERNDARGVLLIDLGRTGLNGRPEWLAIEPTPFHDVMIDDPDGELPLLAERYPDRARAIVRVTVDPRDSALGRDDIIRAVRGLFPRLAELRWADLERPQGDGKVAFSPRGDRATAVRDYLNERLKGAPDGAAVLALAERYLDEGGAA